MNKLLLVTSALFLVSFAASLLLQRPPLMSSSSWSWSWIGTTNHKNLPLSYTDWPLPSVDIVDEAPYFLLSGESIICCKQIQEPQRRQVATSLVLHAAGFWQGWYHWWFLQAGWVPTTRTILKSPWRKELANLVRAKYGTSLSQQLQWSSTTTLRAKENKNFMQGSLLGFQTFKSFLIFVNTLFIDHLSCQDCTILGVSADWCHQPLNYPTHLPLVSPYCSAHVQLCYPPYTLLFLKVAFYWT